MLRRASLLVVAATILACPSKVPKGLVPGAFVRVDSLGNPVVEVERVEDGALYCRQIPSMRARKIPLSQIHRVDPVTSALVAHMRSLARDAHGNVGRRLDEIDQDVAARLQGLMPGNGQATRPPDRPAMPAQLGDPSTMPSSITDIPVPSAPGGAPGAAPGGP